MEFHVGTDRRHLEIPLAVLPVIMVLVIVGKEPSLGMSGFVSVIVNAEMMLSPVALTTQSDIHRLLFWLHRRHLSVRGVG
jgi:hypothetical protein